jgi:hypothetical protein
MDDSHDGRSGHPTRTAERSGVHLIHNEVEFSSAFIFPESTSLPVYTVHAAASNDLVSVRGGLSFWPTLDRTAEERHVMSLSGPFPSHVVGVDLCPPGQWMIQIPPIADQDAHQSGCP